MNGPNQLAGVTTMRVIQDDKELYEGYRDALREASRIAISIGKISDKHKAKIENAVQELFAAEVIRRAHDELRARGISEEFLDESGLRSSLDELPLPENDSRILEAQVRQLARGTTWLPDPDGGGGFDGERPPRCPRHWPPPPPPGQGHDSPQICVCLATGIPGTEQSLSTVDPLPPLQPGRNDLPIAVYLDVNTIFGRRFSGDALLLVVEPGLGIPRDEMVVGLASRVRWAKEIYAWNLCRGKLASVHQSGPNTTPTYMLLRQECYGAHTIVFTKPQFWGVWADVANFDYRRFWDVFGGCKLTFTWLTE